VTAVVVRKAKQRILSPLFEARKRLSLAVRRAAVLGALLLYAPYARGDPAFPAPLAILDAGGATVAALNVGLLVKRPHEATWMLSCGADASGDVLGYRPDPLSAGRILAILHEGVAITDDLGCTWTHHARTQGQLIDAGFDSERIGRIWLLAASVRAPLLLTYDLDQNSVIRSQLLPPGIEIENAATAGTGDAQRWYAAAYHAASGSSYLLYSGSDDGEWSTRPIAEQSFERPRLVENSQPHYPIIVRLMGGASDRIALANDDGSFRISPPLGGYARTVWQNGALGYLVAVRRPDDHLLMRLDAGGQVVESTATSIAIRSLYGAPEKLLALAYTLDGSAPLLQSDDVGRTWSPAVRFAEVGLRRDCRTHPNECAAGCLRLVGAGLLRSKACDLMEMANDDGGRPPAADVRQHPSCAGAISVRNSSGSVLLALAVAKLGAARRARFNSYREGRK
jgi:hypothetical protein